MLLTVLGTPSPLTAAVLKAVQTLAEVAFGSYHWVAAGTAEDLKTALADRGTKPVVLFGDIPSTEITTMLAASQAPVVVALESPATIVSAVAQTRKLKGLPAMRFASQSLATLHDAALSPRAARIVHAATNMPLDELVAGLGRHYGLELDQPKRERLLGKLQKLARGGQMTLGGLVRPPEAGAADAGDVALAARALSGFELLLVGQRARHFAWEPGIFLGARPHGEPIDGVVELIGGRRCFVFGPFFHLPKGAWTATVDFEVSDNISGNVLKIDVYTDRIVWEGGTPLPRDGRYTCSFEFVVDEPRIPLQIRLFNDEGAIEGRFELFGITVSRDA